MAAPYLAALEREAAGVHGIAVDTVYIGGGTPTLLGLRDLERLFGFIRSHFIVSDDAEWTIEANPATFNFRKARLLHELGVNRVSLGIQSLHDRSLAFLGRPHSARQALSAFSLLKKAGFDNINVDLIYGLPPGVQQDVEDDVERLASLGAHHLSAYLLSITAPSLLFDQGIRVPGADEQRRQYIRVREVLEASGYQHYEVSSFARQERFCRHNLSYWRSDNTIGLGSSAHSHRDGCRFWNVDDPGVYIARMARDGTARASEERLGPGRRLMESMIIGLRLFEGVCIKELEARCCAKVPREKKRMIEEFLRARLLIEKNGRLCPTLEGMLVLDEIGSRLV